MASQTAIEYGATRLRLLQFDGVGRKIRVLGVHDVDLQPDEAAGAAEDEQEADDLRADRVADAVGESGFRTDPSAMAFDSGHAIFREFDLPFTNDEQIRKVVRFESEGHMPIDIDEVIVQHVVLRKTRDKSHVLVSAVRKDDLLDRLDILEEAGVDPMAVDIDVFALYHALVGTGIAERHARFAVVDAQERTTSLLFVEDGRMFAVRSVRIGSRSVTHGHDDEPAASGRELDVEVARTHDYLARLVREIRRTLTTLPSMEGGGLEVVYVTGGGSRLEGFEERLGEAFGVPIEPLDLLGHVEHQLDAEEAERHGRDIGVALGMAYKLNGLEATGTDFRREEAAYTKKFDQVVAPLIVVAFLVFFAAAFQAIDTFLDVKRLKREYESMERHAIEQLREMREDPGAIEAELARAEFGPRRIEQALRLARREWEDIASQLGRGQQIPEQKSALLAWIELFDTLKKHQKSLGRFALERLDVMVSMKQPVMKLSGEVESTTKYQVLEDLLRERPMFANISSATLKVTPQGTTRFIDLSIDLDESLLTGALQ